MQFLCKSQRDIFVVTDKAVLKLKGKHKGTKAAKAVLQTKNEVGGISLPSLKLYYIAAVVKTAYESATKKPKFFWNAVDSVLIGYLVWTL